jgi:hypothetical protein
MNRSNSVIEHDNEERSYGLLPVTASHSHFDHRIDFANLAALLSTVETSDQQVHYELEIAGECLAFTFTIEMCEGVPASLEICDELHAARKITENCDLEFDEENPLPAFRFQELTHVLFV